MLLLRPSLRALSALSALSYAPAARLSATSPKPAEAKPKKTTKSDQPESQAGAFMERERVYSTHNYKPLEVVVARARGLYMTDVDGKRYMDFLAAYSAVNQGHNHPQILRAFRTQLGKLAVPSQQIYHNLLGDTAEYMKSLFGYDRVLFMNTGVEAVETALKIARRWAYEVKGVAHDQARILFCTGNFMGRTIGVIGASEEPERNQNFGPFTGLNMDLVPFDDLDALEHTLAANPNYAAFFVEPIQGEAGVLIPQKNYLKKAKAICQKYNVLLIADQIQTGLGRTGKLLAAQWDGAKADIITLGKALGGGVYPVSAVMASNSIMDVMTPGSHQSAFAGNPLACAVARASLDVLQNQQLVENSLNLGEVMAEHLANLECEAIRARRNRGLMGAIEIEPAEGISAWDLCMLMKANGVLAKPTHLHTIRLTPPLIINEKELERAFDKIQKSLKQMIRRAGKAAARKA